MEAEMLRIFPAVIGLGLTALWILGLSFDATFWLTWGAGTLAALAFATVGIIPERYSSLWAGFCLGAIATALGALWILGLAYQASSWLVWCTFAAAGPTALVAIAAGFQGALDAFARAS